MSPQQWVNRMKHAALAVAAGCVLAACSSDNVRIGGETYYPLYYPELVSSSTAGGKLATVIRGNPFSTRPADPDAIAAALPLPNVSTPFRYSIATPEAARKSAHLVLVFGPAVEASSGPDACVNAPEESTLPTGGPIVVEAAFCVGPTLASSLVGFGPAATDAKDPQFQSLMNQVVARLMSAPKPVFTGGPGAPAFH
jgi:hypothetical protein